MKEIFEVHVMDIIMFESIDTFAAGNIGGTSGNPDNDSGGYPTGASNDA